MVVRPYFDSKYQLVNNINYFNALISEGNLSELSSKIFEIDSVGGQKKLQGFNMEIGPETDKRIIGSIRYFYKIH